MCKNPKKFWKNAVLVALAAILGVSILAAPVSALEDVNWICYLVKDGPQESVTRTSYVNPQLATPSLICFPEFRNIGKPYGELRACSCICDRKEAETGAIALLEDKPEVLLAENCNNILNCRCEDLGFEGMDDFRGMTPDEAVKWYDQARIKVKPTEERRYWQTKPADKPTKEESSQWVRDLAYEALINEIYNEIKDSGGYDTLTLTQLNYLRNPDDNEALTDYLIEKTREFIDIQDKQEKIKNPSKKELHQWERDMRDSMTVEEFYDWYDTEVLQGREDKPTKDMTESEWKDYQERWYSAIERYHTQAQNEQKSAYKLTDEEMAELGDYLIDKTNEFADMYGEDPGEKTYKTEDKQEIIPNKQEIIYDNWNPNACDTTDTSIWSLDKDTLIYEIAIWYKDWPAEKTVSYVIEKDGVEFRKGYFMKGACHHKYTYWCRGSDTPNMVFPTGTYVMKLSGSNQCQNSGSNGNGFVKLLGPPPTPIITPSPSPTSLLPTPTPPAPGFEAAFTVSGLLAVAYLVRRRGK